MKSLFEKMVGVRVSCDYAWDDEGIVRIVAECSFATDCRLRWISCPALVFHGDANTIIPISHGERVFAGTGSSQKEFVRVAHGGRNNFQFMMGYDKYVEKIIDFCVSCG